MIKIEKYKPEYQFLWDQFINDSKNGVFLFSREFMEYHSDRFNDHSLLFFQNKKLIAVMPANRKKNNLNSHEGLTFGGLITNRKMTMSLMINIFQQLIDYLKDKGIEKVFYKAIPHIYHILPSEEDLYALSQFKAELIRRDISSAILIDDINYSRRRNDYIKKAKSDKKLKISQSYDFNAFMAIEKKRLEEKYGVKPTHTAEEIALLASRFPYNIKLFIGETNKGIQGGVMIFESNNVAHCQYQATTEKGQDLHVNDLIFDFLIKKYYKDKKFFDFGISTEDEGSHLNEGLIFYKETFGARGIVHDFYKLEL